MIKKDKKVYAEKDYNLKDEICSTTWLESVQDKNFLIPNQSVVLGDKEALSVDDLFTKVGLNGISNYIKSGPKPNTDAYVDIKKQVVVFIASRNIKSGEEIIYTLHPSCFDNVKIQ